MAKQAALKSTIKLKDRYGKEKQTTLSQGLMVNIEDPQPPEKGPSDHVYVSFAGITGWAPTRQLKELPSPPV